MNDGLSIILITYNPIWNKLKASLMSILLQEDIQIELIIADDGSKVRYDEQIIKICLNHQFKNIKFSNLSENVGTCGNIIKALQFVTRKYVKILSPGDMLFDNNTCYKWIEFIKNSNAQFCFGDALYYSNHNEKIEILRKKESPVQRGLYNEGRRYDLFVDYLLANDTILGASLLIETQTAVKYMNYFAGKVKYAEDYIVRLAVFEGKKIVYMDDNVIWYEYGTGISTSKNKKWSRLLDMDYAESNKIIVENCEVVDAICQNYVNFLIKSNNKPIFRKIQKCVMFPKTIVWRLKNRIENCNTEINVDIGNLNKFLCYDEENY